MRLIDKHELRKKVPYHEVHIGRLERAGKFPKRVKCGANRVAWIESEVDDWIAAKMAERDAEAAADEG